jgi:hypothetical protein
MYVDSRLWSSVQLLDSAIAEDSARNSSSNLDLSKKMPGSSGETSAFTRSAQVVKHVPDNRPSNFAGSHVWRVSRFTATETRFQSNETTKPESQD